MPQLRRILTDARGKDQSIDSAQDSDHGANTSLEVVNENIKGQLCSRISILYRCNNLPHVGGDSRNSQQTRLFVQQIVQLLSGGLFCAHQVRKNSRIEGAGSRSHHQTVQGSKSHGGIHATAVANRGERATIAEMTSYSELSSRPRRCAARSAQY